MQGVGQFFVAADEGGVVGVEFGDLLLEFGDFGIGGGLEALQFGLEGGQFGGWGGRGRRYGLLQLIQGKAEGEFDGVDVDDAALVDVAQVAQVLVQDHVSNHGWLL